MFTHVSCFDDREKKIVRAPNVDKVTLKSEMLDACFSHSSLSFFFPHFFFLFVLSLLFLVSRDICNNLKLKRAELTLISLDSNR